jgi:hypothetical protein
MPTHIPRFHEVLLRFTESLGDYAEATRNMKIALERIRAEAKSASAGAHHIADTFKVRR